MLQDGVALVKWLRWLEEAVPRGGETEMSIDAKLTELRMEFADFEGLSFDTIAAYKEHGAIVHYEATPETDVPIKPEGLLLVDTGAQYTCGTTDITRTLLMGGEATEEERRVYTLVLKGHIALSRLKFPRNASGTQLDLAARAAMWREGYNYGHGTGHGVGSHLCVHEGPHQIRMNYVAAPISEGMTVTDEPGIYLAGRFGVRTENVLLCVPYKETEFGTFVGFEPLTLCPIDLRPVDWTMMTGEEVDWLNDYHRRVAEKLMPLLPDEADRQWLRKATEKYSL
jgi:Xaa-Pro aminopeptidase